MREPKVCINVSPLGRRRAGIGRYVYEIVKRLPPLLKDEGVRLELVYSTSTEPDLPPGAFSLRPFDQPEGTPGFYRAVSRYVRGEHALYCNMSNGIPLAHGVVCIHDIRPLVRRDDSFPARAKSWMAALDAKRQASAVVTVSQFSKDELVRHVGIEPERIAVIGNGWEHINAVAPDAGIFDKLGISGAQRSNFYYTLCSRAPHKNLDWIQGVAQHNPDATFVVAGMKWSDGDRDESGLDNVIYAGYITDEESRALMGGCRAFLYPSVYDGFGIPPLEAAACGAPLIVSNASCLPEIYDGFAAFVDPYDVQVDLHGLTRPRGSVDYTGLLKKYSWDASARFWAGLLARQTKLLAG